MTSADRVPDTRRSLSVPQRLALVLGLLLLAYLAFLPLEPPDPVSASAPPEVFSAERAFEHVQALAQKPHPTGSAAHAEVLRDLIRRVEALGLEVEVQEALGTRPWGRDGLRSAWAQNVLTRVEGSAGSDDAVLLVAHYDSTPAAAGAADDASGVAALLETLRALGSGPALRHDVIALFTDAEELGLLGARAFVDHHPWLEDVRLVVNFEARGASGPSIMFETGPGTGSLVSRFAEAAARPLAASYSYDVYRTLPNDTDFSVFKDRGLPGFNFAFIGDHARYHSAYDTPQNLSRASLQHHGDSALALARHFGDSQDLTALPQGPPASYFAVPGLGLVSYSAGMTRILGLIVVLLALALLVVGLRRGGWSVGGLFAGFLHTLLAVVLGLAGGFALHWVARLILGPRIGVLSSPGIHLLGLALAAAGLVTLWLVRRRPGRLLAGLALFWALLTAIAVIALPSTSYLMLWPLLALTALLAVEIFAPGLRSWGGVAVLLVLAVPALWLWTPTIHLIGEALRAVGPGPLAISLLAALLATLLAPQLAALTSAGRGRWALPGSLLVLGLVLVVVSLVGQRPTAEHPYPSHVIYTLDADSGTARWATLEHNLSDWTRQFVGAESKPEDLAPLTAPGFPPMRVAEAPVVDLPPLELTPQAAAPSADGRTLAFRLRSPLGGYMARLVLQSEAAVTAVRLGEDYLDVTRIGEDGTLTLEIAGLPAEGLPMQVTLAEAAPLTLDAVDQALGLPTGPAFTWKPRPPERMPSPYAPSDLRIVGKRYELPISGQPTEPVDETAPDVGEESST